MKHARIALASTPLLLLAALAQAAWVGPSGNPVAPTRHGHPVALFGDGGGGVLVAYRGADVPGGAAIRVQHVLGDGTIASGWPAEGTAACSLAVTTELGSLRAVPDGASGAFLVWNEGSYLDHGMFYVQHVRADGTRSPGWPARGRTVVPSGYMVSPASFPDGTGGVYVFFGAGGGVRVIRIRADGTNASGYPATGRVVLSPPDANSYWSGASVAPADGGAFWLATLLSGTDSLSTPWSYRLWRVSSGLPDPSWTGDDGLGVRIPAASSALASSLPSVTGDGAGGAYVLAPMGSSETVTHVLNDQTIDPSWPAPSLDLGQNPAGPGAPPGVLALDGVGGLFALWPTSFTGPEVGLLRRARVDGTLDPAWASELKITASYLPTLLADATGVFASGARLMSCPHQDCLALNAVGRWSTDGSTPPGWPATGISFASPGEYPLPDSTYAGVVDMVRDGARGVFVAWTSPDVLPTVVPYGDAATVRVMRFAGSGPVAGVGSAPEGPLTIRGTRFSREGIRCSISCATTAQLLVCDLLGRSVARAELGAGARDVLIPGTRALAAGLYLVRVRASAAEAHAKVIVVR